MDKEVGNTPGEKLVDLISELISKDTFDKCLLKHVDDLLLSDREFYTLMKHSIVYYMARRLIHGAWFTIKKASILHTISDEAIPAIKGYLQENYAFPEDELSNLTQILYSCVCASNKPLSQAMRKQALNTFQSNGVISCYMCGIDVNFDSIEDKDSASVEHLFPRTYGGDSEIQNLALSCKDCNMLKDEHMHSADFHFEKMSTKYDSKDADFNKNILREKNTVAFWLKEDCKCSICGKSAEDAGRLNIFKKKDTDSWHFMNIGVSCDTH